MKKLQLFSILFMALLFNSCSKEDTPQTQETPITPAFEKVTTTNLPKLAYHQAVVFNDKIWVIGGVTKNTSGQEVYTNGIYSSADGVTFTNHGNGPFSIRGYHQVKVLNGKLWLFGGVKVELGVVTTHLDIWSSADGINWSQEYAVGSYFEKRYGHQMINYDDKLWCIGGYDATYQPRKDIWYTTDGVNWNLFLDNTGGFGKKSKHSVSIFDNKMLVIGGDSDTGNKNDVWKGLINGTSWQNLINNSSIFSPRELHQTIVKNGKIYVIGGSEDNKVYESTNGTDWTTSLKIGPNDENLVGHSAIIFNDKIHVIGGLFDNNDYSNDIYKSNF
jgi:hypothetical protein